MSETPLSSESLVRRIESLEVEVCRLVGEKERWRSVALRIGEELNDGAPDGYYGWTPSKLRSWAIPLAIRLRMGEPDTPSEQGK